MRLVGLAALLLAACAGAPKVGPPPAAPVRAAPATPFSFAIYGDSREGPSVHRALLERMLQAGAAFVVQTGDLVSDAADPHQWAEFRRLTAALRSRVPYHAAKGNHDAGPGGLFEKEFGLARPYRAVREGPVELFLLDSTALTEEQLAWLDGALAASDAPHKIAVLHNPSFTLLARRRPVAERVRTLLHGRFARAGLCAVAAGHDHLFCATREDGLRYLVSGGGGAPLHEPDPALARPGDLFARAHHFVLVEVEAKAMKGRVVGSDGRAVEGLAFEICRH